MGQRLLLYLMLNKTEKRFFFLVEVDFAMGTKVFGYRDLKNGKFQPRANYSFKIEAFCDGIRYKKIRYIFI